MSATDDLTRDRRIGTNRKETSWTGSREYNGDPKRPPRTCSVSLRYPVNYNVSRLESAVADATVFRSMPKHWAEALDWKHPFGSQASVRCDSAGPWLCVPTLRSSCLYRGCETAGQKTLRVPYQIHGLEPGRYSGGKGHTQLSDLSAAPSRVTLSRSASTLKT